MEERNLGRPKIMGDLEDLQVKSNSMLTGANASLDTFKELGDALGNDPNFATTIATQIGTKADKVHTHQASQVTFTDGYTFEQKLADGSLKGDQGIQGPKGDTGTQGPIGPKGEKCLDGAIGSQGPSGKNGVQGSKGDQGIQGPKGDTGTQGQQGIQGPAGPVNISDAVNGTSSTIAASQKAVKTAYDLANSKAPTTVVSTTVNGLMSSADKVKLDGVATGANNYVHPSTHPASVIVQDASNRFVTDAEKTTWNGKETTSGAQTKATTALNSAKAYTDTKVAGLVGSVPETLDTLKELGDALGNDPNFATTVSTKLGELTTKDTDLTKQITDLHNQIGRIDVTTDVEGVINKRVNTDKTTPLNVLLDNTKNFLANIINGLPQKSVWTDTRATKLEFLDQSISATQANINTNTNVAVENSRVNLYNHITASRDGIINVINSGRVVKSVQRGLYKANGDVTISWVDPNKSLLIINTATGWNSSNNAECGGSLINHTTIKIYSSNREAAWQVIEFY